MDGINCLRSYRIPIRLRVCAPLAAVYFLIYQDQFENCWPWFTVLD